MPPCTSAGYFYHSSDLSGTVIADVTKSSTFAFELIEELFSNSHNLLVISFSVINYVVSMRRPRVSGEVSFFLICISKKMRLFYPQSLRDSPEGHTVPHFVRVCKMILRGESIPKVNGLPEARPRLP